MRHIEAVAVAAVVILAIAVVAPETASARSTKVLQIKEDGTPKAIRTAMFEHSQYTLDTSTGDLRCEDSSAGDLMTNDGYIDGFGLSSEESADYCEGPSGEVYEHTGGVVWSSVGASGKAVADVNVEISWPGHETCFYLGVLKGTNSVTGALLVALHKSSFTLKGNYCPQKKAVFTEWVTEGFDGPNGPLEVQLQSAR